MKSIRSLMGFLVFVFAIISPPVFAFDGLVTQVHDGDTLTVKNENGAAEKIRIYRIDAPELKGGGNPYQPYASEARTSLLNLCNGKVATVIRKGKSYGRTVGIVSCDGDDVADWQINNGSAWAYRYTATKTQKATQARVKLSGYGLWALQNPIEPYLWRKGIR